MTPEEACGYLADQGLAGRKWWNDYEQDYGCASNYRQIGPGGPLPNNLAYYGEGTKNTVERLWLVLNVNNRAEANSGREALLKAAQALSERVTSHKLPSEISRAILRTDKASARLGITSVEVLRIDWPKGINWPAGKGYEIKVIFK
jgi:hypothetical protein